MPSRPAPMTTPGSGAPVPDAPAPRACHGGPAAGQHPAQHVAACPSPAALRAGEVPGPGVALGGLPAPGHHPHLSRPAQPLRRRAVHGRPDCVVLESYPPRAQCVPTPKPDPGRCTSSDSCPAGTRCSTERGDCQGCGGGPGVACPAVCFGVCEPSGGQSCSGGAMMGGCRSADDLKLEADKICRSANAVLTDFALGSACFAGGFAEAKYTCCRRGPSPAARAARAADPARGLRMVVPGWQRQLQDATTPGRWRRRTSA